MGVWVSLTRRQANNTTVTRRLAHRFAPPEGGARLLNDGVLLNLAVQRPLTDT